MDWTIHRHRRPGFSKDIIEGGGLWGYSATIKLSNFAVISDTKTFLPSNTRIQYGLTIPSSFKYLSLNQATTPTQAWQSYVLVHDLHCLLLQYPERFEILHNRDVFWVMEPRLKTDNENMVTGSKRSSSCGVR